MSLGKSLAAAVLAVGTVGLAPLPAQAQAQAPQGNRVTLITGDRVVVTGSGGHRVEPGPGRQVDFVQQVRDGHLHVIPSDAMPLIAQGVLDRRLFDVTQLLAWGYGDAHMAHIPVISQAPAGQTLGLRGSQQARKLSSLGMNASRVPKAGAAQTWKDLTAGSAARTLAAGRTKLWLDGRRSFSLHESVKQIGAPQAWQQGLTGKGVTVAVLDSGYDPDHPDLKDAVVQARNFSDDPDISDPIGHGTHVASIVAGRGEKYRGVAPEAHLAIAKVGGSRGPTDSAAIAGMEWAAVEVKAKIVNMSFGEPDSPGLDPLEQAVNTLSERTGTLFVTGTGNNDPRLFSPGSAEAALTVGAVDKQGRMADFSNTGPRVDDHAIKPEVTAPGVGIMAAAASGTADGPYVSFDGTSMAAPHVAGAAAVLAQQHPEWTGTQLKAALIGSAAPVEGATLYQQGAGLIDLARGTKQQVVATPANVWAAFPWNGDGERAATKTITYTNTADTPVTLNLSAQGEVLKLPAEQLTVPANGQASITLTIDTTGKTPGDYPGTITATSGDTTIRTLAGAYVEPESYTVTVTAIGKQGQKTNPWTGQVYDPRTGTVHDLVFRDGVATARIPKGDWNLFVDVVEREGHTIANVPLKIDGADRQVTVDARQGRAAKVTLDDPNAELQGGYDVGLTHGEWQASTGSGIGNANTRFFVIPSDQPGLIYSLATVWLNEDASPSPYIYQLVHRHTGGLPEDPAYHARQKELATITATYRASGTEPTAALRGGPLDDGLSGWGVRKDIPLPSRVIYYRTPNLTYNSEFEVGTSVISDGGKLARPGHTSETWNAAVTGPSFTRTNGTRTGDTLTFSGAPLFADGQPGRTGSDSAATGTLTLTQGGQTLATTDLLQCDLYEPQRCVLTADLPTEPGTYTLTASAHRQAPYSTRVESAWTFPSRTTAKQEPLPLTAVRYTPTGLDDHNRAEPGTTTRIPLWVERNPGAAPAKIRSLKLEMSTDDGTTWRRVPVTRTHTGWTTTIPNPRTPGHVSLRAVVTDTAGTTLTQTITRAYAVG